jgi:hypothetical protein
MPQFLIWPTFQGHRGQSSSTTYEVDVLLFDLESLTLHERVSRLHLRFYQISAQSDPGHFI